MNLVDSSGWIEYFARGENAHFFIPPIQDSAHLVVPTICIYDVFKRLLVAQDEDAALLAAGLMSYGIEISLDRSIAMEAAHVSREFKFAMADSIILATARIYKATLWTQDAHFKGLSGVQYIEKT